MGSVAGVNCRLDTSKREPGLPHAAWGVRRYRSARCLSPLRTAPHSLFQPAPHPSCAATQWVVELDSSTEEKFSRHLIIRTPGHAFADNIAAGALRRVDV